RQAFLANGGGGATSSSSGPAPASAASAPPPPPPLSPPSANASSAGQWSAADDVRMDALWEQLKVVSLARLFASVYALTLMDLMLRVQSYVAGRVAFEETAELRAESDARRSAGGGGAGGAADAD